MTGVDYSWWAMERAVLVGRWLCMMALGLQHAVLRYGFTLDPHHKFEVDPLFNIHLRKRKQI